MSSTVTKEILRRITKICQDYGVDISASADGEKGLFINRFVADKPGWNSGTKAMAAIIRFCRRKKIRRIRLNAYPTGNGKKMHVTNLILMRWYMRFGYHQTEEFEPNACNELILTIGPEA